MPSCPPPPPAWPNWPWESATMSGRYTLLATNPSAPARGGHPRHHSAVANHQVFCGYDFAGCLCVPYDATAGPNFCGSTSDDLDGAVAKTADHRASLAPYGDFGLRWYLASANLSSATPMLSAWRCLRSAGVARHRVARSRDESGVPCKAHRSSGRVCWPATAPHTSRSRSLRVATSSSLWFRSPPSRDERRKPRHVTGSHRAGHMNTPSFDLRTSRLGGR